MQLRAQFGKIVFDALDNNDLHYRKVLEIGSDKGSSLSGLAGYSASRVSHLIHIHSKQLAVLLLNV